MFSLFCSSAKYVHSPSTSSRSRRLQGKWAASFILWDRRDLGYTHLHSLFDIFADPLLQDQLGESWWHQAKLHSFLYRLTWCHNIGHLDSHYIWGLAKRDHKEKTLLTMLQSFKKTPSRAAHFLQPPKRNQCLPPAQKLSDGGRSLAGCSFLHGGGEGFLCTCCSGCACGGPGSGCEVRRDSYCQMSKSPCYWQGLQGINPFSAHGKRWTRACLTTQGQDNLLATVTSLSYSSPRCSGAGREIGDKSQRPAGKTHVPALLQGLCRWSWPSPQQRLCTQLAEVYTFRKYFFRMAGLLRWFMVSDFWTFTWKDKGGEGKKGETF